MVLRVDQSEGEFVVSLGSDRVSPLIGEFRWEFKEWRERRIEREEN